MRAALLSLVIISVLLVGAQKKRAAPITDVKVWNGRSDVVQEIRNSSKVTKFEKLWNDRDKVTLTKRPNFTHSVDVTTARRSTTWRYDPQNGYAEVFSKRAMPVYRVRQPAKLRALLIPETKD